jgi:hypothetical protein
MHFFTFSLNKNKALWLSIMKHIGDMLLVMLNMKFCIFNYLKKKYVLVILTLFASFEAKRVWNGAKIRKRIMYRS